MVTFVNFESLWPKFERRSFSKAIIFSSFVLSIILNKYSIFSTRRNEKNYGCIYVFTKKVEFK